MSREIHSFFLTEISKDFRGQYPSPEEFKKAFREANHSERRGMLRLWLTEGIPFAFKEHPILYEQIRSYIATGIGVHPKEVTLVGSARTGYSMRKVTWGRTFSPKSDLDFTIISKKLFDELVVDFKTWAGDFGTGKMIPRSPGESKRWLSSIHNLNSTAEKGYINTRDLFPHAKYKFVKGCYRTMSDLYDKLTATSSTPAISDASVRVYSGWDNCIDQLTTNFKTALDMWPK